MSNKKIVVDVPESTRLADTDWQDWKSKTKSHGQCWCSFNGWQRGYRYVSRAYFKDPELATLFRLTFGV